MNAEHNWAGCYTYRAARRHQPETVAELRDLITGGAKVKALGTRHSFNDIADTTEDQISLAHFDRVLALDRDKRTVTIEAGIRYGDLCRHLHEAGFALHNLASLPHISVAGACATATHGSGDDNGNLATAVSVLEMIMGDGENVALSRERDGDTFSGAVVGLGALGVVTQLTLDVVPAFAVRQDVYRSLPWAQFEAHLDAITSGGYSVSLFTDWRGDAIQQVWRKRVVSGEDGAPEPEWFGATLARRDLHPLAEVSAENCTAQGVSGPWHERLPHFRMAFTPSRGEELQTEYLVPRSHALAALRAVRALQDDVAPHLLISEIRTVAADGLWMSPCYRQPCVAVHFTWKPEWPAVRDLLPRLDEQLAPFDARPHWGKLFTTPPERIASLYPRLADFQRLRRRFDPRGKFDNAYLKTVFGEAMG